MTNTPIINKRDGNIKLAVFEKQTQDGKTYYSVVLQRSYKKKDTDEYINETINLFPDDVLKTAKVLENGYVTLNNYILQKQTAEKAKKQTTQSAQPAEQVYHQIDDEVPF